VKKLGKICENGRLSEGGGSSGREARSWLMKTREARRLSLKRGKKVITFQ